jgi:hypothetical protein
MSSQKQVTAAIETIIKSMMNKVMHNVLVDKPFIIEEHRASKPLYAALVPDEIFKGSHFERRFVTPFGKVWEKLAMTTASIYHGYCGVGYKVQGTIGIESLRRIQEVLNTLEHGKNKKPDWAQELLYVRAGGGSLVPVEIICDLFVESKINNKKYAFELKAPLPNSDQTKVSKEKLFKLLAMQPPVIDGTFFALPYNPYGKKSDYVWSFPKRWFDMVNDECVLIGEEFWDFIGGKGTYENFIAIVNNLGAEYKIRIYQEFLGIEPPVDLNIGDLR